MTTSLVTPPNAGAEHLRADATEIDPQKQIGRKLAVDQLSQFREVWGREPGVRYFLANITMHQAGMIHGLSGDRLRARVKELGLPQSVLPKEVPLSDHERYFRSLGSTGLAKAAAAIASQNPLICK